VKLRFDPNQDYQVAAIDSVADLFEGQPRVEFDLQFSLGSGAAVAVGNRLDLDEGTMVANLARVQQRNGLAVDGSLALVEAEVDTASGPETVRFANFSVEMETGTGKTYVYLRTVQELYRRYAFRKFIIVVPSVAIREGVLKTLALTSEHLGRLYGNPPYHFYGYSVDNLALIRQFALSDGIEVMVITIDAFNKRTNVLRQPDRDRFQGETPIHLIQAARPILILDEPQNMETELRLEALAALRPLCALRYSATHRNPYNNVYRLSPFEAYRQGLVKRIEVAGVEKRDDIGQPYIRLDSIKAQKRVVTARLSVHALMKTGAVKEKAVTVRPGDSLAAKTNRPEYGEYVVEEINPGSQFISFANHCEIKLGDAVGADRDTLFDAQIRYTIEEHFRKQARVRDRGIKVLSLFFIDRVAKYADDDGPIRERFEHHFDSLKETYPDWVDVAAGDVHAGYFAQRRRRSGEVELLDSSGGDDDSRRRTYDLIMRDKERLMSFDEPVAFVFSHSALREGWDNPNVFQICTLNETGSEVKKRQEVGRGMRLPVDQAGERVADLTGDALTIVANESYDRFVRALQQEIIDDYGEAGAPPAPGDARKRGVSRLRKRRVLSPEFRELWERIQHRTRYTVEIDTERLIGEVAPMLDALTVSPPRVTITKAQVTLGAEDALEALQLSAAKTVHSLAGRYPLPNLVDIVSHLMEHTSPPMHLTRKTLLDIFCRVADKSAAMENPHEFATNAVQVIKQRLADQLVGGIQYFKVDERYEMSQLESEIESWEQYLVPSQRSVYDHVVAESDIEQKFVEYLEKRGDIKVYVKLPSWFKVPTPVGAYNPDWALVLEDRDEHGRPSGRGYLYLVRETKSTYQRGKLRPDEERKTDCGRRHFEGALKVDYEVVTNASEI
jgi:type III restriction enzyme